MDLRREKERKGKAVSGELTSSMNNPIVSEKNGDLGHEDKKYYSLKLNMHRNDLLIKMLFMFNIIVLNFFLDIITFFQVVIKTLC